MRETDSLEICSDSRERMRTAKAMAQIAYTARENAVRVYSSGSASPRSIERKASTTFTTGIIDVLAVSSSPGITPAIAGRMKSICGDGKSKRCW